MIKLKFSKEHSETTKALLENLDIVSYCEDALEELPYRITVLIRNIEDGLINNPVAFYQGLLRLQEGLKIMNDQLLTLKDQ